MKKFIGEALCRKSFQVELFFEVKTHTAMSVIVEIGDSRRFAKADQYAAYLGLCRRNIQVEKKSVADE